MMILSALLIVAGTIMIVDGILNIFRHGWDPAWKFTLFGLITLIVGDAQRRFIRNRINQILKVTTAQANNDKTGA